MNELHDFFQKTFGIGVDTSASILISLIVFISGYIVAWVGSIIKNALKRREDRKQLKFLLTAISNGALKQSKNFYSSLSTFNIKHIGNFTLKNSVISHLNNIEQIDFNNFYVAYFTGIENTFHNSLKRKAFNRAWAYIYHLQKIEGRYLDQLNDFIIKFNAFEDKRNEALDNFVQNIRHLMQSVNGKPLEPDLRSYIKKIDDIFCDWQIQQERTHYYVVQTKLINPISIINKDYIKTIDFVLDLNNQLLLIEYYYLSMERQIENCHKTFYDYYGFYKLISKLLNLYLKYL